MSSLLACLAKEARNKLFDNLVYLNMNEIKTICKAHSIPFKISYEDSQGKIKVSKDLDRKGIILNRMEYYLKTGTILHATCFPKNVVGIKGSRAEKLTPKSHILYGDYSRRNLDLMTILSYLTAGKFKDGAMARILIREYWTNGEAPTCKAFSSTWLELTETRKSTNKEWVYLSDLTSGNVDKHWKEKRNQIATQVMSTLQKISVK